MDTITNIDTETQISFQQNASKLHKTFGIFLLQEGLGGLSIKQEVNVKSLIPTYDNPQDRYDYYLPDMNLIVEIHGEQHYKPVYFGGDRGATNNNYIRRVIVDNKKAMAAIKAGYLFIVFKYDELNSIENIRQLFYDKIKEIESFIEDNPELLDYKIELESSDDVDYRESINKSNKQYYQSLRDKNKEKDKQYRKDMYRRYKDKKYK